jgi:hypothetical protein
MIDLPTDGRLRIFWFVPDTTQIFQILDIIFFNVFKQHPRYKFSFGDGKAIVQFKMKGDNNFKPTMMDPNTWGTIKTLGIELAIQWRTAEGKGRISRFVVDWFLSALIAYSAACHDIWVDWNARMKWYDATILIFHWSGTEISSFLQQEEWNHCEIHHISAIDLWISIFSIIDSKECLFVPCSIDFLVLSCMQIFSRITFFSASAISCMTAVSCNSRFRSWKRINLNQLEANHGWIIVESKWEGKSINGLHLQRFLILFHHVSYEKWYEMHKLRKQSSLLEIFLNVELLIPFLRSSHLSIGCHVCLFVHSFSSFVSWNWCDFVTPSRVFSISCSQVDFIIQTRNENQRRMNLICIILPFSLEIG